MNNIESHLCTLCSSALTEWEPNSPFFQCKHCGLITRKNMPTTLELDIIYQKYYSEDSIQSSETNMISNDVSTSNHAEFIKTNLICSNAKCLDYGAGTGALVEKLRSMHIDTDGYEISKDAVHYSNGIKALGLISKANQLKKNLGMYDLVILIEVVEHLTDPVTELNGILALLKPGGCLYLTTPNAGGINALIRKSRWSEAEKPFHLMLFTKRSLRLILKEAGFQTIRNVTFSPLTSSSLPKSLLHRVLQALGLYGGLRFVAYKKAN